MTPLQITAIVILGLLGFVASLHLVFWFGILWARYEIRSARRSAEKLSQPKLLIYADRLELDMKDVIADWRAIWRWLARRLMGMNK